MANNTLDWRSGPLRGPIGPSANSPDTKSQYRTNAHPRRGGGRSRAGRRHQAQRPDYSHLPLLDYPMFDPQTVNHLWTTDTPPRKQWIDNPKGVLSNYCQQATQGAPQYQSQQVMFMGLQQPVYRVTVQVNVTPAIVGVGDDPSKKEAEKLAALSACFQLGMQNLFDQNNLPIRSGPSAQVGSFGHTMPDGSHLTLDKAKAYMDFYCKKFKFGKPEIHYENCRAAKGRESWAATLFVGGKKIGLGQANTKKDSLNEAYLDTVVYLAECDRDLWIEFGASAESKEANIGGAVPEIVFRLSNDLEDDLRQLAQSSGKSELYQRAQTMLASARRSERNPHQIGPNGSTQSTNRSLTNNSLTQSRQAHLEQKSSELMDRLGTYQTDLSPHVVFLREQRQSLPVTAHSSLVLSALATNPVTILMAATGSGKTTQVPQLILDEAIMRGQGARHNIICTQPRRIAAISVAQRVANERNEQLSESVGYQVRFEAKPPTPDGSILFCTTGVFLRRLQNDMESADGSFLDPITHIVVDEVHERDIDTDLLLFCLRRVLKDRKEKGKPDIKVLLMSATVDPTLFERYFADPVTGKSAPVIRIPGRSFPVQQHFLEEINGELRKLSLTPAQGGWVWNDEKVRKYLQRELQEKLALDPVTGKVLRDNDDLEMPYALIALVSAWVLSKSSEGHVLVFLPGWEEIKGVQNILSDPQQPLFGLDFNNSSKYEVHVLHSAIPVVDQQQVFTTPPKGVRRIILSTNIAETSVTIPDVVFVVDTGKIKEKRFDPERHLSSLITAWVGTSNLNQRAGRAGRHRPGDYYGLLSRRRYDALNIHSTVEMKRTDLSNLVMHVKALNFPNMEAEEVLAQTIEPPERERVSAAMSHLQTIGALDRFKDLTALGRVLLQLPVEAQIGKLLLMGSFFKCLEPALNLAAILTNRDPFLSPPTAKAEADRIKSSWAPFAFRSDPLACLAAFSAWSVHQDPRFANDNFLSKPTLAQISQVKSHLLSALRRAGVLAISGGGESENEPPARFRSRHQISIPPQLNKNSESMPLLAALIAVAVAPNFAVRKSTKIFATNKDRTCFINLSSVNSYKKEAAAAEDIPLQNERQLFAFGEKSLSLPRPGEKGQGQMSLRSTTRLDPLGYMLLGARQLQTYSQGLRCDGWLPITGNEGALDDVERLKTVLDASLLRVFDGLQAQIFAKNNPKAFAAYQRELRRSTLKPKATNPNARVSKADEVDGDDESVFELDEREDETEEQPSMVFEKLTVREIRDLEQLTEGVVTLLNRYSEERLAADASRAPSRPDSRMGNAFAGRAQGNDFFGNGGSSRPGSRLAKRDMPGPPDQRTLYPSGVPSMLAPGGGMRAWGTPSTGLSRAHTPLHANHAA